MALHLYAEDWMESNTPEAAEQEWVQETQPPPADPSAPQEETAYYALDPSLHRTQATLHL